MSDPRETPSGRLDLCSCHKPREWWGSDGWHMRPFSPRDARRLACQAMGLDPLQRHSEADEDRIEEQADDAMRQYGSTYFPAERCPVYYAAVVESTNRNKAARAAGRHGGDLE